MTQNRALAIVAALVLIWAIWAGVQYFRSAPERAAKLCTNAVARQIADEQRGTGIYQPWETVSATPRPDGPGWVVPVEIRAHPAQGDPYTITYVCTVPGQETSVRLGDWIR